VIVAGLAIDDWKVEIEAYAAVLWAGAGADRAWRPCGRSGRNAPWRCSRRLPVRRIC